MTVRRRRSGDVPAEVVAGAPEGAMVQWRASVMLNLVLQSSFLLSIATCQCALFRGPRRFPIHPFPPLSTGGPCPPGALHLMCHKFLIP